MRRWQWVIECMAIVVLVILMMDYLHNKRYGAITDPEVLDFLQSARNISQGRGMTTFVLRPIALSLGLRPYPLTEVYHPPLPLIVFGIMFAIIGEATQRFAVVLAGLWLGLAAVLLLIFARRFVSIHSAWLSMVLFLLAPLTLQIGANANPATLTTFLFALWVISWAVALELNTHQAIVSGMLLGAAGLCNGLTLLAMPVAFLDKRWRSWRERIIFILALACVLLPCIWRNVRLSGHPFTPLKPYAFLLDTEAFPQDSIYRCVFSSDAGKMSILRLHLKDIWQKCLTNIKHLPTAVSQCGWFVLVGTLLWVLVFGRKYKTYLLCCTIILMFVISILLLTRLRWDAILFLLPFFCLMASAFAEHVSKGFSNMLSKWLKERDIWPILIPVPSLSRLLIFGLVLSGQLVEVWRVIRDTQPVRIGQTSIASVASISDDKMFVASDEPRIAAWYAHYPIVWLPCRQRDWEKVTSIWQISQIWLTPFAVFQRGGDIDTMVRISYVLQEPLTALLSGKSTCKTSSDLERWLWAQEGMIALAMGEAFIRRGQWKLAEQALRVGVWKAPSAISFFRLGQVWSEMGRHHDAVRAYQAALGEDPRFYPAANNLAWSYLEIGEIRPAAYWADFALKLSPSDPFVLDTASIVALKQGRYQLARRRAYQALKLAPNHPTILKHWLHINQFNQ